ncbi:hypothetical protein ENSA5_49630 [Enhygromyxa salina]|uniref:Uncharacterized protein n=1 Tax=Enhygromyxa salina TaxID=215803 RepID=A0A2S9XHQ4_9BACT|nr:hypothetical protein [Enhygromyxa salina]PRP92393.1 hypothetical protein ENSA5_49630 [Enhygromyxa salina]
MLSFGSVATSPEFVPSDDAREWLAGGIVDLAAQLGAPAQRPHLLTDPPEFGLGSGKTPGDLDSLFDMICAVQEVVGQSEVELTLLELDARGQAPKLPPHYQNLGDPSGKLLHTLRGPDEYLVLFTPAVFKVRELLLAGIARELGRVALDRAGLKPEVDDDADALQQWEADAELAGVLLGMGIWVANGAYMFENSCCGGGCGVDLRSVRAGLSMPEACYALAVDSQRKGLRRRAVLRHLAPTQKAATKKCWSHLGRALPPALAAASPEVRGRLT